MRVLFFLSCMGGGGGGGTRQEYLPPLKNRNWLILLVRKPHPGLQDAQKRRRVTPINEIPTPSLLLDLQWH